KFISPSPDQKHTGNKTESRGHQGDKTSPEKHFVVRTGFGDGSGWRRCSGGHQRGLQGRNDRNGLRRCSNPAKVSDRSTNVNGPEANFQENSRRWPWGIPYNSTK